MVDRLLRFVFHQVLFSDIAFIVGIMHQDMVPGLVLRWPALGIGLIPVILSEELGIDIYNNTPVIKQAVMYTLPY
jgi:hypothetical protein